MQSQIQMSDYWNLQKKYLQPHFIKVILLGLLLLSMTIIQVFSPFLIQWYIDLATENIGRILFSSTKKTLNFYAFLYIILSLLQFTIYLGTVYIGQDLAWSTTNKLRYDLTFHTINLDMSFHNRFKAGEMIERIDGDINTLAQFFSQFSVQLLTSFLLIIGIITVLFIKNWIIGLVFFGFTIFAFILIYFLRDISVQNWEKERQSSSELFGVIEESLNAIEDIKTNDAIDFTLNKFFDKSRYNYKTFMNALFKELYILFGSWILLSLADILVFSPSFLLFENGKITLGTIFFVQMIVGILILPIYRIIRQVQQFQKAAASIRRITYLFHIKSEIKASGTKKIAPGAIELEFENVNFSYIDTEPVLKGVSFKLNKGKKLGLVGHTGSGKTTLSRLIFRLYDINEGNGRIKINNIDIKEYDIKNLRSNIAYVTQDIELFQASLRNNITFFDNRISDKKIIHIMFDLGLKEWFKRLPDGLDTIISSDEQGLSAGEAQLLTLTRVFLKKPNLVILDEASSRLDPVTENLVKAAIDKLLVNRTAIIIAHRLETLDNVDEILVLDKGKVIEYGERKKLVKDKNSYFYQLLKTGKIEEVLK
ncbi:MAG: ABC transporter ATP-binding protein/permease [Candidatus Heimdallarchaeum endolithica]|uniref:ABC transporter ATP-binding protein/permease n=1 Tax=Candidatus Heimdallarchaeum endolithica TaxID=2876572 RepID=A0A9Y1FQ42_9ARCH|nr:MAG: ABC transporter ATP-binding protein/permease [Candidatus Heimdallarchaeum endolithica]